MTAGDGGAAWYKDAIIYELHVRAFYDSSGDGVGDLPGLTSKLPYLKDLGVTAVWILPHYPSPLRDDGYDIADYRNVHPAYGTLRDFKALVKEAHRLGLRVITELVLNHTSDQHPWFQRARRAPRGSRYRNWYVWSDTPDRYRDARIIFQDFETSNWAWDPVAGQYYWHRFYSHQPDLNYENAEVRRAMFDVVDYWLAMGVDGLRLDAVPYLFEEEGTNCENLPRTHAFLRELRRHVDERFPGRMLLAEANQWPEDAVAYFGDGDECHMAFHFPLMPRLFMGVRMEDRYPIVEILEQTPAIPESCQWALFLRNHDELTLEMVTDEERDYMYRVYAHEPEMRINLGIRRRLAPLLENNRRQIELLNALLFSFKGTPVLYYGDEIGMGDNVYLGDRNGVRTPMQWSPDRNAGFSPANPQRLYLPLVSDPEYRHDAINVETQQGNLHGLLWWMKRLIDLRKRWKVFGEGSLEIVPGDNRKVLALVRSLGDEQVLCVFNLSRFPQSVALDLGRFAGCVPTELFGGNHFPQVGPGPYQLALGPHAFYWFALTPAPVLVANTADARTELPVLPHGALTAWPAPGALSGALDAALRQHLLGARWFRGKGRHVRRLGVRAAIPLAIEGGESAHLAVLTVDFREGESESYLLPLLVVDEQANLPRIARLAEDGRYLVDASGHPGVAAALYRLIARRRALDGPGGELAGVPVRRLPPPSPAHARALDQTNTTVVFGDQAVLKLFRRLDEGANPEQEMTEALRRSGFKGAPEPWGTLEFRPAKGGTAVAAVLEGYVHHECTALDITIDELERFFERVLVSGSVAPPVPGTVPGFGPEIPPALDEIIGGYLDRAELLGRRTAEMHLALASAPGPAFAPEAHTSFSQRSLYQALRSSALEAVRLAGGASFADPKVAALASRFAALQPLMLERLNLLLRQHIGGQRIRTHGDLHLAQVLFTGSDFVFIDFEGEPARPLATRRMKRSPLRDVAGMVRSFDYASAMALWGEGGQGQRQEDEPLLAAWRLAWAYWAADAYVRGYREVAGGSPIPPANDADAALLGLLLLEKALYEVTYEIQNRPQMVVHPLRAVLRLLGEPDD